MHAPYLESPNKLTETNFALNFGDKRTGCCITTMHQLQLPFSPVNFNQKQQDCHSPPTHPTYLFPQLKINLKGRHFDTTEVRRSGQNALTEHDFQDASEEWQHWEWCTCVEGDRSDGAGGGGL
jgi:hypothetical protein